MSKQSLPLPPHCTFHPIVVGPANKWLIKIWRGKHSIFKFSGAHSHDWSFVPFSFTFAWHLYDIWESRDWLPTAKSMWEGGWCWNDQGVMVLEIPELQCKLIDLPPLITNAVHMEHICCWRNEVLWLQWSKAPGPALSGDPLSALPWAAATWGVGFSASVRTQWHTQNHLGKPLAEHGPMACLCLIMPPCPTVFPTSGEQLGCILQETSLAQTLHPLLASRSHLGMRLQQIPSLLRASLKLCNKTKETHPPLPAWEEGWGKWVFPC